MEGSNSVSDDEGDLDEEDNDYDYSDRYTPPKRTFNPLILDPDDCKKPIANLRKQMLNPELDRYDLDEIAQTLAHYVVASGELNSRIQEIKTGRPYKGNTLSNAMRSEYEALISVRQDKQLTAQRFGKTSSAMAVSSMLGNRIHSQPVDLMELKTQMEDQMKALADSGANRQDKLAMFVLQAQQMGEALMVESASALTGEAKALILEKATKCMEKTATLVEKLDALATPKTGRVIEPAPDKQLSNKTKKLRGNRSDE